MARAGQGPLVVVLLREREGEQQIADHFVLERPGPWRFLTTPGLYRLGAFEDRNADGVLQPTEPVLLPREGPVFRLGPGARRMDVELVIDPDRRASIGAPLDIAALQARSSADQLDWSLGRITVVGQVVPLDDPRFSPERAEEGLWRPLDFIVRSEAGVYFAEPYDPTRIPVLFVHGILGSPRGFAALAKHLDPARFQPWFYYYPSGAHLDRIAKHLSQVILKLTLRHRCKRIYVVAHSMGGLVARAFVFEHAALVSQDPVRLLVTLSTPWSGQGSAAHAARAARRGLPMAPSWLDVAPKSAFLEALFHLGGQPRRLPDGVAFHLLFGYQRRQRRPGPSSDGVIALTSQLRLEAQHEASSLLGVDAGHAAILHSPAAIERVNEILAKASTM
ncbi:MAG: alpha/beta hydrolase [Deltaproteobacteria bacterium]|nr:alpha/beta hydrolase [Deltaproteobacteria bacterium]